MVIVEDITRVHAFDAVLDGVDAIMHLASPVTSGAEDPDEVILPAVCGTKSILHSALSSTHRRTIKRILTMSSCSTIWNPPASEGVNFACVLNERDWNMYSVQRVREAGRTAPGLDKYRASKVLAERAAWGIYEQEKVKGDLGWDLVVLNPPLVIGPIVHEALTLESFKGTPRQWYDIVVKGALQGDALMTNGYDFVDVRDLARAHVLSLTVPHAGGERFIIRGHSYVWQQFVDAARCFSDRIPSGNPSYSLEEAIYTARYSAAKSQQVLGIKYRTLEETTKGIIEDIEKRGWL